MMPYRDWPVVLKRKWIMTLVMGLQFFLVGVGVYLALNDRTMLLISTALVLCTALRCASFYWTIYTGNYEITEGFCIEICKADRQRRRKVRLLEEDGNEWAILLDKRTPIRIGSYYRIYYEVCPGSQRGSDMLPVFAARQFLAVEDLSVRDSEDDESFIQ